jgi:hypothetical protein
MLDLVGDVQGFAVEFDGRANCVRGGECNERSDRPSIISGGAVCTCNTRCAIGLRSDYEHQHERRKEIYQMTRECRDKHITDRMYGLYSMWTWKDESLGDPVRQSPSRGHT